MPVVLAFRADRMSPSLGRARFVDHADGIEVRVFCGDDHSAPTQDRFVIPLDCLKKPLERSWCDALVERDRFNVFAPDLGEQASHVDGQ